MYKDLEPTMTNVSHLVRRSGRTATVAWQSACPCRPCVLSTGRRISMGGCQAALPRSARHAVSSQSKNPGFRGFALGIICYR